MTNVQGANIVQTLTSAKKAVHAQYAEALRPMGISYPQYVVIQALGKAFSPQSLSELCVTIDVEPGSLSPLLKRMSAAGTLTRTRRKEDERTLTVELTSAGKDLWRQTEHIERLVLRALPISSAQLHELGVLVDLLLGDGKTNG